MNTQFFRYLNTNPMGQITTDCIIRSLSLFLDIDYLEVLKDLLSVYISTGYHISDPVCFRLYLNQLNNITFVPLEDFKSLYLKDLCTYVQTKNYKNLPKINSENYMKILVFLQGNHLTFVNKGVIEDIGDCSSLLVKQYWIFDNI